MDLGKLASQLLTDNLGVQADGDAVSNAISNLLGDGGGNIDLAGLASKMSGSDLGNVLSSWLGDGANEGISAESVLGLLGEGNVEKFASQLGTDPGSAASGLSEILPQIMDQASSGGNLLESVGGVGGLLDAAKSFLK